MWFEETCLEINIIELLLKLLQRFHEKLPRPYKDTETVKDAFGHVIGWPKFIISTFSCVQALHPLVSFDACLSFL